MSSLSPQRLFSRASRTFLYAFVAFIGCMASLPSASAQEQESRMQKILNGDVKTASFGANKGEFKAKGFNTRSANVKEYQGQKKFQGKDFLTSDYAAVKKSTQAEMKYAAKNADTEGRGGVKRLVKEHETSEYGVKKARDSVKEYDVKTYATAEAKWKKWDKVGLAEDGAEKNMGGFDELKTIDDIRDLLNKLD